MSASNIALIVPLIDARRSRKTGIKASDLSRLIAARFAVPRGFVISVDAYRSHLWATGARGLASKATDEGVRERVRASILSRDIPDDVWQAIAQAYERLSWQVGCVDPEVIVRLSYVDGGGPDECVVSAAGADALKDAVRRAWAHLWNGGAGSGEPAAALIVQQVIRTGLAGAAFTVDPVTGDPNRVVVSCEFSDGEGVLCPVRYSVDLNGLSVVDRSDIDVPGMDASLVALIAEKALLVENTVGGRVRVKWAYEGGMLWVLDVRPLTGLPVYFPVEVSDDVPLRRLTSQPVSRLARSGDGLSLAPEGARLVNGYAYAAVGVDEPADREIMDVRAAWRLLGEWQTRAMPGLRSGAQKVIRRDLAGLDDAALAALFDGTVVGVRSGSQWLTRARRHASLCCGALRELLDGEGAADSGLYRRLLSGLPDPTVMRDARLQELGERFAIAERSGKAGDEKWWRAYKHDVEEFARDYGYSFRHAGELCDPAGWRSWVEDTEPVFRIIAAMAGRDGRPSLVTLHCAAERDSAAAAVEAAALFGRKSRGFEAVLNTARAWLVAISEAEYAFALSCVALRLVLADVGRRMCDTGLIADREDVFRIALDEVHSALRSADGRGPLSAIVADRKHASWLESRLAAPEWLPHVDRAAETEAEAALVGIGAASGIATGRVRVAESFADAGEVQHGDILVVKDPGLAWTPFLAVAGGVVAEQGSAESLAAVLAREYGIPAVLGCDGAAAALTEGRRVTLDGDAGTVELSG